MLKFLIMIVFFMPSLSYANYCSSIIRKINLDIETNSTQFKNQDIAWNNISWLQNNLGPPQKKTINANLYQWQNFQLLIRSDHLNQSVGDFPQQNNIGPPSLHEAIKILGQPQKKFMEKIDELTWHCDDATLVANIVNHKLLIMKTKICKNGDCKRNVSFFDKSELENKMNQSLTADINQVERQMLASNIKMYNDYFRENVQDEAELERKMVDKYKLFYSNLRSCQPGKFLYAYVYPMTMNLVVPEAEIKKSAKGDCILVDTQEVAGIGKIIKHCQFKPSDLSLFSDQEAELAGKGNISYDSENLTALQLLEKTHCKFFLNGEPTPTI